MAAGDATLLLAGIDKSDRAGRKYPAMKHLIALLLAAAVFPLQAAPKGKEGPADTLAPGEIGVAVVTGNDTVTVRPNAGIAPPKQARLAVGEVYEFRGKNQWGYLVAISPNETAELRKAPFLAKIKRDKTFEEKLNFALELFLSSPARTFSGPWSDSSLLAAGVAIPQLVPPQPPAPAKTKKAGSSFFGSEAVPAAIPPQLLTLENIRQAQKKQLTSELADLNARLSAYVRLPGPRPSDLDAIDRTMASLRSKANALSLPEIAAAVDQQKATFDRAIHRSAPR